MNYRMTIYIMGEIAVLLAILLFIPFIMAFAYGESGTPLGFGVTIAALCAVGVPCVIKKPKNTEMRARGGFIIVALAWILLSLFGAMPFRISGYVTNYLDCIFETVSGFTTTGASILTNVEALPKSLLFWRNFTNWIGGMGVLIFVIAVLPKSDAAIVHLAKAETPGPVFGKLVSKLRFTARILYAIYIALTLMLVVFLVIGKMPVFDAFVHAFGTAGTGGFSIKNMSIAYYNSAYIDIVITVFMFIFSINFNLFYLVLIGSFKQAIKSEELRVLFGYFFVSIVIITISLMANRVYDTFGDSLRYASFQVASMGSTTGFSTADFASWPVLAQIVLFVCMFIGGSAGSTSGGLKVSRIIILVKSSLRSIKKSVSPRSVSNIKIDRKTLDENVVNGVTSYFGLFMIILAASVVLVSVLDGSVSGGFTTNLTAVVACLNNIGPGLGGVGPLSNFASYSVLSKIVLIFDMLLGRLELMPILLLFYPRTWKRA